MALADGPFGIGFDFGTTNSSVALADSNGNVQLAEFTSAAGLTQSYRSLLYLDRAVRRGRTTIESWTGPEGIERYLEADTKGRLVQSLKSFLASKHLRSTEVFGRQFTIEELVAKILRDIRLKAEEQLGRPVNKAIVGRPVRFVGSSGDEDDSYAESRLDAAFQLAGFEEVSFMMEPVAAALFYESSLDHDELILIGDFGGGTSDFSLIRVGPASKSNRKQQDNLIGNDGVGLAGDAFDAKLVRHLVGPELGSETVLDPEGKSLPIPRWLYSRLERWHHLSFLKTNSTLALLRSLIVQAAEPEKIQALLTVVEEDLGFPLHRSVQQTKYQLSQTEQADFIFNEAGLDLKATVTRRQFESWIAEELGQIAASVDRLLTASAVEAASVDKVFLTGGTSFVPAVRNIFVDRFGIDRVSTGEEFTSVARGLALGDLAAQSET